MKLISFGLSMCFIALVAGCVRHEIYGESTLLEDDLTEIEGYWHYRLIYDEELHIASIDGKRNGERSGWPYAYSVSVPSGDHWLQFAILRNGGVITMCALAWHFEARYRYKLLALNHNQSLLAHPEFSPFPATVSIAVTASDGTIQHIEVPAVCGEGPMCRQDADCSPNDICQANANLDFGVCKLPSK